MLEQFIDGESDVARDTTQQGDMARQRMYPANIKFVGW